MALVNRDKDVSEKKTVLTINYPRLALSAGTTFSVYQNSVTLLGIAMPFPAEIRDIYVSVLGISGSPTYTFDIWKQGNGASVFSCSGALTLQAVSTSGPLRASLLAAGSTSVQVNAGDLLVLKPGAVANTAVDAMNVTVVLQALQDIKAVFGVST